MEEPFREAGLTADDLLIETLGWDGTRLPRRARHLARLAASAARLGFAHDGDAVAGALAGLPLGPQPMRLRLTLARGGAVTASAAPLAPTPGRWRVALAPRRIAGDDPLRAVKTTARRLYDADRAALPAGIDELLYANAGGGMAEGTITNLFFDAGQGLCTPPLASGCLPGCLRAELLQTGRAREADLPLSGLGAVRLWCGNSLRGLIPAVLATARQIPVQ